MKDILERNIVSGKTAWMLKELGYKGWVSGYYHENQYEAVYEGAEDEDALEYFEYECIGSRSGFVNENARYRAAAPTLVEAFQFLVDKGSQISVDKLSLDGNGIISATVMMNSIHTFYGGSLDEVLEQVIEHITECYYNKKEE